MLDGIRFQSRIIVVIASLWLSAVAQAWGDLGHEAVGEIAERNLTPAARQMVQSILGVEPMAVAATFPDHVRSDPRFKDFAPYHFIEIPDGFEYDTLPPEAQVEKDAHAFISQVPALLKDPTVSRARKMLLLRYLIHVVGDVHQPLHVGNGRDLGANLCDVLWEDSRGGTRKHKLHEVWDSTLMDEMRAKYQRNQPAAAANRWFGYQQVADTVLSDVALTGADRQRITAAGPLAWYKESQEERAKIYPDARPIDDPKDRPYCKYFDPRTKKVVNGSYDASRLPRIGAEYKQRALEVLERQILKGGLRLAALLNETAKDYRGSSDANETEAEILAGTQLENPRRDSALGQARPHVARRERSRTH